MKLRLPCFVLTLAAASCGAPPKEPVEPATKAARADVLQPRKRIPRTGAIDVEHYALDLEIFPHQLRLAGTCRIRLHGRTEGLDTILLDLHELDVEHVGDADGNELQFYQRPGHLEIDLGAPLPMGAATEVVIAYAGSPRKGLWFAGGDPPTHVFTQGECEDARWWFPCWDAPDDRATSELRVRVPLDWSSVGPGTLVDSREEGGRRVDTWRMSEPHPTYLLSLVAGDLTQIEAEWNGVPLLYASPPELAHRLEECLAATDDALEFVSRITRTRYPFAKYATCCVDDFPIDGMENISATTLTSTALRDELALLDGDAEELVVHEAAHQWFGDLLTCTDWSHIWLNEGLATYLAALYFEETRGVDDYRVRMGDLIDAYLRGDELLPRPIVFDVYHDPIDLFFTGHAYEGGAARLHLLRFLLGDEAFRDGLARYVGDNAGRSVVTDDLRAAFEAASGTSLEVFFDQWLESPGHPEFEVRWRWDQERARVLLTVQQVHAVEGGVPEAFETPVDVEVRGVEEGTSKIYRLDITRRRQLFELAADAEPLWVRFDKYRWIPGRVRARKPLREWLAIINLDDDVSGRRFAIDALVREHGESEDAGAREGMVQAVARRLRVDEVDAVRVEAARALGRMQGDVARQQLVAAAQADLAPAVRVAALTALTAWGAQAELRALGEQLYGERASYAIAGAAAGLVVSAAPNGAFAWLGAELDRVRGTGLHGELERELIARLGGVSDPRTSAVLLRYARDRTAREPVRIEAVRQLPRHVGDRVHRGLKELLATPLARLRFVTVRALAAIGDRDAAMILSDYYPDSVSPRERRTIEHILSSQ